MSPSQIVLHEECMNLREAQEFLGVSRATLDQYRTTGYRGARLEVTKIGKRPVTSREAIGRFLDAINNPKDAPGPVLQVKTKAERKAEIDAAMAEVFASN